MKPYDPLKRAIDVVAGCVGLVVTAPIQTIVAVAVLKTHGRPVLFRQLRPGKDGKVFELVKFRTMLHPDETRVSDADRLTPLGKTLRATSLDELPTLWNVFRGDMSLVGPRPLLVEYLALYSPHQSRRHEVRPGVTGLAQVNGRNETTWEKRLDLDVEYVDSRSLVTDVKILFKTVETVFRRTGISAEGEATMSRFTGQSLTQD